MLNLPIKRYIVPVVFFAHFSLIYTKNNTNFMYQHSNVIEFYLIDITSIILLTSVYILFKNASSNVVVQSALPSGSGGKGDGETIIEKIIRKTNEYKWYLLGALVVGVALYAYSKGYVFSDNKEEAINSLTNQAIPDNSSPTTPTSTTSTTPLNETRQENINNNEVTHTEEVGSYSVERVGSDAELTPNTNPRFGSSGLETPSALRSRIGSNGRFYVLNRNK